MAAYEDDVAFFESEYSESESESSDDSIPRVPLEDVLGDLMEDAMAYVEQMGKGPALLTTMNKCIVKNKAAGLYDGCKMAVEEAMKM